MPRRLFVVIGLALAWVAACKQPGRIDLVLRAPRTIDLATAFGTMQVNLISLPDGLSVGQGVVAAEDLADLPTVLAKANIDPGRDYVFELSADVDAGICASGRIVGRSVPVSIEKDDETLAPVAVYVACANGFDPAEDPMRQGRSMHAAVLDDAKNQVVIVGGASSSTFCGGTLTDMTPLTSVERYDLASGTFLSDSPLISERVNGAATLIGDGRIFVMGGGERRDVDSCACAPPLDDRCSVYRPVTTVEVLQGSTRTHTGNLAAAWFESKAMALSDGSLAIFGLGALDDAFYSAEIYDPVVGAPRERLEGSGRLGATVVPFEGRDRALMFAGSEAGNDSPTPVLLCAAGSCPCGEAPCRQVLEGERDASPGPRWHGSAGAYLGCADGGGTAYVAGGTVGNADEETLIDDLFCLEDHADGTTSDRLVRVGALRHRRTGHSVTAIRGGRLLVAGGNDGPTAIDEAEVVSVNPCTCEAVGEGSITETAVGLDASLLTTHSATLLGDGTVLIAGALTPTGSGGTVVLNARDNAWIFNPEL